MLYLLQRYVFNVEVCKYYFLENMNLLALSGYKTYFYANRKISTRTLLTFQPHNVT